MLRDIKFPEKYYVGFQKQRYSREENFRMLGFATPNTGDYAFKKRKASVDGWSEKDLTPLNMENKPTHGFKIVDAVSRYSTSNKKFRVEDPRGFELEIDVYNLLEIIEKHTIVQGAIMEQMIWGRFNGDNYLVSGNSAEYKHHVSGAKVGALTAGIWMKNKAGNVLYRFEGRMAYNLVASHVYRKDPNEYTYRYAWSYDHKPRTNYSNVTTKIKTIVNRKQDKPAFVYSEFHLDENGVTRAEKNWYREDIPARQKATITIRKTEIKDLLPVDESEVKCAFAKAFTIPLGEMLREVAYENKHRNTDEILNETNYSVSMNMSAGEQTVPVLFKTKAESMDKTYDAQALLEFFKPLEYRKYYSTERHADWHGTITYVHEDSAVTEITDEDE
jgi:hypothetical protein